MIEETYNPPCDVSWFQAELDRACARYAERNVKLRIAWAPQQVVVRYLDAQGNSREYKKYPILTGYFDEWIEGYAYMRRVNGKLERIAYRKNGNNIIPPNVRLTDVAIVDARRVNPSIHIFVIEKRVADHIARPTHEEKRLLALVNPGFDLFGPFPSEGVWDWLTDVSEHRDGCCVMAGERGIYCHGLYRPPDGRDLERVQRALQLMEESGVLDHEDHTPMIERGAKNLTQEINRNKELELIEVMKEGRELDALDEIARSGSRIAMGINPPRHRTAY